MRRTSDGRLPASVLVVHVKPFILPVASNVVSACHSKIVFGVCKIVQAMYLL